MGKHFLSGTKIHLKTLMKTHGLGKGKTHGLTEMWAQKHAWCM